MARRKDPAAAPSGKVGYGHPPVETRFKPGQSGNPNGRPPRPRGAKPILAAELNELITVTVGGKRHRVTLLQTVLKRLVAESAKGDLKATSELRKYISLIGYDPIRGSLESIIRDAQESDDPEVAAKAAPLADLMWIAKVMVDVGFYRKDKAGRYSITRAFLDRLFADTADPSVKERTIEDLRYRVPVD
jgi:hypothetical protein